MAVIYNALEHGYNVEQECDVSEDGFSRQGFAVLPDEKEAEVDGTDMARWTKMRSDERLKEMASQPCKEISETQESRQLHFDNWETTYDHCMLIFGTAKDQTGKLYYMVKNSWGTDHLWKGVQYASKAYMSDKTIDILVHKDAIPKDIAQKIGIK